MKNFSRKDFIKLAGIAGAGAAVSGIGSSPLYAQAAAPRVVVVGAGSGGATAARYIKMANPKIDVTLIEKNRHYVTCYFSNLVIGDMLKMKDITHDWSKLKKGGINVVNDEVTGVDPVKKTVTTKGGKSYSYDKLVLSPGISFKWDALPGYDEAASEIIPHAWKAGPQTELLVKQLKSMKKGGTFIINPPANPFRCPPGPYERAGMVAHYFKKRNPTAKIMILDNKDNFSKEGLFKAGWTELYGDMIEFVPGNQGGKIVKVDPKTRTVTNADGEEFKADVLNIIPAQKGSLIVSELTGAPFAAVDPVTFESEKVKDVHVIGDSCIAGDMPKSGTSANSQAKACAHAIVTSFAGGNPGNPVFVNTCYSMVGQDYAISVVGFYRPEGKVIKSVAGTGGVSPAGEGKRFRSREANYAQGWYIGLVKDMFG